MYDGLISEDFDSVTGAVLFIYQVGTRCDVDRVLAYVGLKYEALARRVVVFEGGEHRAYDLVWDDVGLWRNNICRNGPSQVTTDRPSGASASLLLARRHAGSRGSGSPLAAPMRWEAQQMAKKEKPLTLIRRDNGDWSLHPPSSGKAPTLHWRAGQRAWSAGHGSGQTQMTTMSPS